MCDVLQYEVDIPSPDGWADSIQRHVGSHWASEAWRTLLPTSDTHPHDLNQTERTSGGGSVGG
jgi:hypothetical protein